MKNYYMIPVILVFVLIPVTAARPMTSLFAKELEASIVQIGYITASYSIVPLLIAIFAGRFVDRYGERIPMIFGAIGIVCSLLIPFFYPTLLMLLISQLMLGGSQLVVLVACQNGIARSTTLEKRDKAFSTLSLSASIGTMFGPLIGGYLTEQLGFQYSYLYLSLIALLPLGFAWFVASPKGEQKVSSIKKNSSLKDLFVIPGLKRAILVSMLILASLDIFSIYYPLYATNIGLSPIQIGWVLAVQSLASIITRLFMPSLVNKFGRINVLFVFMFFGGIAYGLIVLFDNLIIILLITIIIGVGLGITQPLTTIISYNLAPNGRTGEVLGLRLAGNRLSQVLIPFIFASISNVIGLGSIFIVKSILLGMGAVLAKGIKENENTLKNPPIKKISI